MWTGPHFISAFFFRNNKTLWVYIKQNLQMPNFNQISEFDWFWLRIIDWASNAGTVNSASRILRLHKGQFLTSPFKKKETKLIRKRLSIKKLTFRLKTFFMYSLMHLLWNKCLHSSSLAISFKLNSSWHIAHIGKSTIYLL